MTDLPVTSTLDLSSRGGPARGIQLLLAVNTTTLDVPSRGGPSMALEVPLAVGASIAVSGPSGLAIIPSRHSGVITLTLVGTGTSFSGPTVFTIGGATGCAISAQRITNGTAAELDITTGSGVGNLSVNETITGSATGVIAVAAATLAITETPLAAAMASVVLHLTGINTIWTVDSPVFALGGGIGGVKTSQTILTNTTATLTLTTGTVAGTLSVTDPSTTAVGTTTVAVVSLLTSLRAYWALEETTPTDTRVDSSGNGNHLTPFSGHEPTSAAGVNGGTAAHFTQASTQSLSRTDTASLQANPAGFTLAAWVYFDSLGVGDIHEIAGKLFQSVAAGCEYYMVAGGNIPNFAFFVGDDLTGNGVSVSAVTDAFAVVNTWYLVIGWHDGTTHHIQVNNGAIYDAPSSVIPHVLDKDFTIGSVTNSHNWHDGRTDEVALWGKSLSAAERAWLYNGGNARTFANVQAAGADTSGGPSSGSNSADLLLLGIL